jgi:hypothetical protein
VTASTPTSDQSGPPLRSNGRNPPTTAPPSATSARPSHTARAVPGRRGVILRTAARGGVSRYQRATHRTIAAAPALR